MWKQKTHKFIYLVMSSNGLFIINASIEVRYILKHRKSSAYYYSFIIALHTFRFTFFESSILFSYAKEKMMVIEMYSYVFSLLFSLFNTKRMTDVIFFNANSQMPASVRLSNKTGGEDQWNVVYPKKYAR